MRFRLKPDRPRPVPAVVGCQSDVRWRTRTIRREDGTLYVYPGCYDPLGEPEWVRHADQRRHMRPDAPGVQTRS